MQVYSDQTREDNDHALPDIEVFYSYTDVPAWGEDIEPIEPGWYWWPCFPGCMPDSEPVGPFATEEEAIADAQDRE